MLLQYFQNSIVSETELKQYFAVVIMMGIIQLPSEVAYWEKSDVDQLFIPNIMSRNR